ncbi:MAG: hypothetical protein IJL76_01105 [Bacilli bacterium]|nr:hypothetical protein [Bacilli bacterium]
MDKKKEVIIMAIIAIVVVIIAIIAIFMNGGAISQAQQKKYVNSIEEEADQIKKSEMKDFNKIDIDKYLDLYKGKDESIVMIGRTDCEFCPIAEPILKNIAHLYDLDINYLSLDTFDDKDREKLLKSDKYFEELGGVETPMILIVKDKKIIDHTEGLYSGKEYTQFFIDNSIIEIK